jgi:hypothetical protein
VRASKIKPAVDESWFSAGNSARILAVAKYSHE